MKTALTIAGSDSVGGAESADPKMISGSGVFLNERDHGDYRAEHAAVSWHRLPADLRRIEIEAVVGDLGFDAVKTGFATAAIVEAVRRDPDIEPPRSLSIRDDRQGGMPRRYGCRRRIKSEPPPLGHVGTPNVPGGEVPWTRW
jgi:hypothetical protein